MTAPEPFDTSPPGRLDAPGRRGVAAHGRAMVRPDVAAPAESPLRQLLRTTAAHVDAGTPTVERIGPKPRWRRPERHLDVDGSTGAPEAADAVRGRDEPAASPVDAPAASAPAPAEERVAATRRDRTVDAPPAAVPTVTEHPATVVDDELPPVLRAVLAARAAAASAHESAATVPAPEAARPEVEEDTPVETARPEVESVTSVETARPEVEADAPVDTVRPEVDEVAPVEAATPEVEEDAPVEATLEPAPAMCDPEVLAASLPGARLAAVACAAGEPEPPICRPAAGIVSRMRPLSPLRALVRHGRRARRTPRIAVVAAASLLVATVATGATAAWAAMTPAAEASAPVAVARVLGTGLAQDPPPIASLDAPTGAAVASVSLCDTPAVQTALAAADPAAVIAAAGGAQAFHDGVVGGGAPCLSLGDSAWPWVVVNKQRPNSPVDYSPATVVVPDGVTSVVGGGLRPDAAAALSAMVAASRAAGAGDMAVESAYRSYGTQSSTHDEQVASAGEAEADATSARAGYSEHQTGLAADLVACDGGCGSMDDFGASAQGQWVAANGWQYGWIVRYESASSGVTGYEGEPWHLRYIGPELAALYHAGGFHTLEEFWGLAAAPGY